MLLKNSKIRLSWLLMVIASGWLCVGQAGEKVVDHNDINDENSRMHIKNYHKYGYQHDAARPHHRRDKIYRTRPQHSGRYGYENRHRPQYRQSNRYYPSYHYPDRQGIDIRLYKNID